MPKNNISDIRNIINGSLDKQLLGRALAQLQLLVNKADSERLEEIKNNYRLLLQYLFDGVEDPDRIDIFRRLLKETYELTDDVCAGYTTTTYSENSCFSKLWNVKRFTDEQIKYCSELNSDGDKIDTALAVAAITLNCLRIFDEDKVLCLADFCNNKHQTTTLRALTGLVICLTIHQKRLQFYPAINNRLNLLFDNKDTVKQTQVIVKQLIRSKETERITKDISENIIPKIAKLAPKIREKMDKSNFDSEDFEEKNANLQDIIAGSEISEKMRVYSELQMEGSDINMSTFSQLKGFPFFNQIENWFIPFYKENPAVSQLFQEQADNNKSLVSFLTDDNFLCDSDKYSFCINLSMIPETYRKSMSNQLRMESEQMKEDVIHPDKSASITNRYIQDLYRFFKLFRDKKDYEDIFTYRFDIHKAPFFRLINPENEFLPELSDYFFTKEQYENALSAYLKLETFSEPNADLYKKIAFCYQKTLFYTQAISYYEKADIIESDQLGTLRKLAYCHRKSGQYKEALDYYIQIDKLDPNNLNTIFNMGMCSAELRLYDSALNYFYKIDFLNPDKKQSMNYQLYFGHCLWATGKRKEAINCYREYIPFSKLDEILRLAPVDFTEQDIAFIIDYLRYNNVETDLQNP